MQAPEWFVSALTQQSGGRLRIRWSLKRGAWHIEQQVGRAALPPLRISEADDGMIRARDGYWFVMELRPGDRMPCPKCHLTIKVPVMQFGEAICLYCKYKGNGAHRYKACYYPLGDMLLEHLRKIDPHNDGLRRIQEEVTTDDARRVAADDKDLSTHVEDVIKDNLNSLFDVGHTGYTGKETYDPKA